MVNIVIQDDNSIAFFQLLVNVAFAALLGAILATIVLLDPCRVALEFKSVEH